MSTFEPKVGLQFAIKGAEIDLQSEDYKALGELIDTSSSNACCAGCGQPKKPLSNLRVAATWDFQQHTDGVQQKLVSAEGYCGECVTLRNVRLTHKDLEDFKTSSSGHAIYDLFMEKNGLKDAEGNILSSEENIKAADAYIEEKIAQAATLGSPSTRWVGSTLALDMASLRNKMQPTTTPSIPNNSPSEENKILAVEVTAHGVDKSVPSGYGDIFGPEPDEFQGLEDEFEGFENVDMNELNLMETAKPNPTPPFADQVIAERVELQRAPIVDIPQDMAYYHSRAAQNVSPLPSKKTYKEELEAIHKDLGDFLFNSGEAFGIPTPPFDGRMMINNQRLFISGQEAYKGGGGKTSFGGWELSFGKEKWYVFARWDVAKGQIGFFRTNGHMDVRTMDKFYSLPEFKAFLADQIGAHSHPYWASYQLEANQPNRERPRGGLLFTVIAKGAQSLYTNTKIFLYSTDWKGAANKALIGSQTFIRKTRVNVAGILHKLAGRLETTPTKPVENTPVGSGLGYQSENIAPIIRSIPKELAEISIVHPPAHEDPEHVI